MAARPQFQRLVEKTRLRPPLPTGIVYPCDRDSLQAALSGAFAGYLEPVLIGPEARIRDAALRAGLDISRLPIIDTPDDPRVAGQRAAEVAHSGKVAALVKGSMFSPKNWWNICPTGLFRNATPPEWPGQCHE